MRVPTYQPQIPYRAAHAQDVPLAKPLMQAMRDKKISRLEKSVAMLESAQIMTEALAQYGANRHAKTDPEESDSSAEKSSPRAIVQPFSYSGFSDPARRQLLTLGRELTAAAQSTQEPSAIEKLDEQVGLYWQQNSQLSQEQPDRHLLAQDYVILRQEMAQLQAQQQQQVKQQSFQEGAGNFIEVASLVRSPQVLQSYVDANLAAAEKEAQQNGVEPASWKQQAQGLYAQAVQHNIQAALQAGELAQAQAVYTHFADKLSAAQQALLQQQFDDCQTQQTAQGLWLQLQAQRAQSAEELSAKSVEQLVDKQQLPSSRAAAVKEALNVRLQAAQQQHWLAQAHYYEQLLTQDNPARPDMSLFDKATQWQKQRRLVQGLAAGKQASSPQTFTALYEGILHGTLQEKDIDRAYDEQTVSAQDSVRLKHAFCLAKAQQLDPRENLLWHTVEQLCRQYQLSEPDTCLALYCVGTAGTDLKAKRRAAAELKNLLTLQEK